MAAKATYSHQEIEYTPEEEITMFEVAMNPQARQAFRKARVERARAAQAAFGWLFPSRVSR